MPNLTLDQAQSLYDNKDKRTREYVDNVYYTTRLVSRLDGFHYDVDSARDAIAGITDVSSDAVVETEMVAYLQTQIYKGTDPLGSSISF